MPKLKVSVYSFSYKNGIPEDNSGNGGGFVFDCRAIDNPGKLDVFKPLTGLDNEVKRHIESFEESAIFFNNVKTLTRLSVERYIERGFTSLVICFGCTGGRHRSVYFAEALTGFLTGKYDIDITLTHRERASW